MVVRTLLLAFLGVAITTACTASREEEAKGERDAGQPAPAAAAAPESQERVATDPSFIELPGQVVAPLKDFPSYTNARLIGSSEQQSASAPEAARAAGPEGYRVKWMTSDSVPAVMDWYQRALATDQWTVVPEETTSTVERLARIRKGNFDGYIAAEATTEGTEIVLSVQDVRRATSEGQR